MAVLDVLISLDTRSAEPAERLMEVGAKAVMDVVETAAAAANRAMEYFMIWIISIWWLKIDFANYGSTVMV